MDKNELWGRRVIVSKKYHRTYTAGRKWESDEIEPVAGIVMGFRTIQNGHVDWDRGEHGDRESGNYFIPDKYIPCALVALTPYQNPIRVPLDGFEVIKNEN